jgi:hypothetical protein
MTKQDQPGAPSVEAYASPDALSILHNPAFTQYKYMPRLPRKTSVLTVRVAPEVKAALEKAAAAERRSLANMLEVAVLAYCRGSDGTRQPDAGNNPPKKRKPIPMK